MPLKRAFQWITRDTLKGTSRRIRQFLGYWTFRFLVFCLRKRKAFSEAPSLSIPGEPPFFSLLLVAYRTPPAWLHKAVNSVRGQLFPNWELCIGLCEIDPALERELRAIADIDTRIRLFDLKENLGISLNTNAIAACSKGDFLCVLDHDDYLEPHALREIFPLASSGEFDLIYTDEDIVTANGMLLPPNIKPDWAPETHLSYGYICHLCCFRRSLFDQAGGFHSEFDNAQDYDLFLRMSEKTERIAHIPKVLYHWRRHALSSTSGAEAKPTAWDAGKRAVESHLQRIKENARVERGSLVGTLRVRHPVQNSTRVDIIMASLNEKNLGRCLNSILRLTRYPNYRICIVGAKNDLEASPHPIPGSDHILFLEYSGPFNLSSMNNFGAKTCDGDLLLFLSEDVEITYEDWLEGLLEQMERQKIGAVGPLLLSPEGLIRQAGLNVDEHEVSENFHAGSRPEGGGYNFISQVVHNVTAVSSLCLCTRRKCFLEVGGFDEQVPDAFNDIDYCLRLIERGYRIVYTPYTRLVLVENISTHSEWRKSKQTMLEKWNNGELHDRYFNAPLFKPGSNLYRLAMNYLSPLAGNATPPKREQRRGN